VRIAERTEEPDRGTLVQAALLIELRGGAVHLAVGPHGATAELCRRRM
jgi:hypothetical protein